MRISRRSVVLVLLTLAFLVLSSVSVSAQTWTKEQTEVWGFIQSQWDLAMKKDSSWVEQMVHMKALGWDLENPMPRDRGSLAKWNRFESQNSTTLVQELNPVGIIVHRNTAVVHYYYSVASEDRQGEREMIHGRYTDVLVKQDGKWQFIAWAGGETSDDD